MPLRHRIGLLYIPGALPCFEDFGALPTDLVTSKAEVDGKPASEVLDMLIIPGGSLVESQSVTEQISREIIKMAELDKFVLGICSGFQVLGKETDVGRLSTIPIIRSGLGLLDVEFKPLICTDRVKASIIDKSFITKDVGESVKGFHCHTYGKINIDKDTKPFLISHVNQVNYKKSPQDLISGVVNKTGNVAGVLIHSLLDNNQNIINSIMSSLDINEFELQKIREANSEILAKIRNEIGISTSLQPRSLINQKPSSYLFVTGLGSGSGKTFITTGIAGALKKRGLKVGVIKVGGDIRDAVPSLYLIKEPIKEYSSIKIGESGWTPIEQVVEQASQNHDLLLVEGAMGAFTGLFNYNYERPMSTVEVAVAMGISTIIVVACDQEGIEGVLVNAINYIKTLQRLGVNVKGVVLNKIYLSYLNDEIRQIINQVFSQLGVEFLGMVPRLNLEIRGMIPEIEIRYDTFGAQALDAVENNINLDLLVKIAYPSKVKEIDYESLARKFKEILTSL